MPVNLFLTDLVQNEIRKLETRVNYSMESVGQLLETFP